MMSTARVKDLSNFIFDNLVRYLFIAILLATMVLVAGCGSPEPNEIPITDRSTLFVDTKIPSTPAVVTPAVKTPSPPAQASLSVLYPVTTSELIGGQTLRVLLYIQGGNGMEVEGAEVQVEIWSPAGEYTKLNGGDVGRGRYLTDFVQLPIQGAAGTWIVQGTARLENDRAIQVESTFESYTSFSEGLETLYGFWLDTSSSLFAYVGPHIVDPAAKYHVYQDGGGYVILANTLNSGSVENFVILDVHWRPANFPLDESAAENYVRDLAGPHAKTVAIINLDVQQTLFQGQSAWHVKGQWIEPQILGVNRPGSSQHPIEWLVFACPESDWLWTLLITTNTESNMIDLRAILESFECPTRE